LQSNCVGVRGPKSTPKSDPLKAYRRSGRVLAIVESLAAASKLPAPVHRASKRGAIFSLSPSPKEYVYFRACACACTENKARTKPIERRQRGPKRSEKQLNHASNPRRPSRLPLQAISAQARRAQRRP